MNDFYTVQKLIEANGCLDVYIGIIKCMACNGRRLAIKLKLKTPQIGLKPHMQTQSQQTLK